MTAHLLTALYHAKGSAESGRDDLAALGVPIDDIAIRSASMAPDPTAPDPTWQEPGVAVVPAADRLLFDEGLRRGGYLLTARVGDNLIEDARQLLEHLDPVDLAEHTPEPSTSDEGVEDGDMKEPGTMAAVPLTTDGETASAHPPSPADPAPEGGFGDSIADAATPKGHGTVRRRVRTSPI